MSPPQHLVPLALAALGWMALARVNRATGWFRPGEVIFWDAVVLVRVFLVWILSGISHEAHRCIETLARPSRPAPAAAGHRSVRRHRPG